MQGFDSVIDKIISLLSEDQALKDVNFISFYPISDKPVPIDKTYVTVGLKGIKILSKGIGDYQGISENKSVYGSKSVITVSIKIYSATKFGGNECLRTFSKICDSLMFRDRGFAVDKAECGKIQFDRNTSALVMECEIDINTILGHKEDVVVVNK